MLGGRNEPLLSCCREPEPDHPHAEHDRPERRAEVSRGLEALSEDATGLANVSPALDELLLDAGLAWRAYACALLADELEED